MSPAVTSAIARLDAAAISAASACAEADRVWRRGGLSNEEVQAMRAARIRMLEMVGAVEES